MDGNNKNNQRANNNSNAIQNFSSNREFEDNVVNHRNLRRKKKIKTNSYGKLSAFMINNLRSNSTEDNNIKIDEIREKDKFENPNKNNICNDNFAQGEKNLINVMDKKNFSVINSEFQERKTKIIKRKRNSVSYKYYNNFTQSFNDLNKDMKVFRQVPKIKKVMSQLLTNSICICCHSNNEESKILEEINDNFYEQFDVFNYLKINQRIKLINYLLLNEDQRFFLETLAKPTLNIKKGDDLYHLLTNNEKEKLKEDENEQTNKFWNKFIDLENKPDKTEEENKLYYLICAYIISIIN